MNADTLVISIMAGISMDTIEAGLLKGLQIVRVMPNLPASVKQGMAGICGNAAACADAVCLVQKIFNSVGKSIKVQKEEDIDSVTAVSGSGPAYIYYLAEQIQLSAKGFGFNDEQSKLLAVQTILGAAT